MNEFRKKFYAVIGLGNSGRASADFLIKHGAKVHVFDDRECVSAYPLLTDDDWDKINAVVVSPGIHLHWDKVHVCVQKAREKFIPIITDMDIFQRICIGKNICITGTNGKSTTTALIYHVIKQSKYSATIGGNFGPAILSVDPTRDFNVFELSSYQLEGSNILGFDFSVLLNIASDHLARHGGMNGYISAKQKIFSNFHTSSYAIVSVDDIYCKEIYRYLKMIHPHLVPISGEIVPKGGIGWYNNELIDDSKGVICKNNPLLEGTHNRQNIAAAYAVCKAIGLENDVFINGLMSFRSLDHRQQLIATIDGVQYINDSKATNCDSVEQALKRYDDVIWILGGRSKEEGIEKLTKFFSKIRYALLIGEVAGKWSKLLSEYGVKNEIASTLDIAVKRAREISEVYNGKVVLLSPACASFDQFKCFEERGDRFKELVQELKC